MTYVEFVRFRERSVRQRRPELRMVRGGARVDGGGHGRRMKHDVRSAVSIRLEAVGFRRRRCLRFRMQTATSVRSRRRTADVDAHTNPTLEPRRATPSRRAPAGSHRW